MVKGYLERTITIYFSILWKIGMRMLNGMNKLKLVHLELKCWHFFVYRCLFATLLCLWTTQPTDTIVSSSGASTNFVKGLFLQYTSTYITRYSPFSVSPLLLLIGYFIVVFFLMLKYLLHWTFIRPLTSIYNTYGR